MIENISSQKIKAPNIIFRKPLDLSVVIRCGRDKKGLERTLSSVDENVEVIVSASDDVPFLSDFQKKGYKFAPHTYGNWSVAAQSGINKSTNNNVIIMDSDSIFGGGALKTINTALKKGHLLVQPKVIFLDDGSTISKTISNARTYENQREPKSYSPGLGLKVQELTERIGINGNLYNLSVAYGDDGDLNQRRKEAKIDVHVAKDALIYHDPIALKHELRTVYQFGIGKRQAQNSKTNPKTLVDVLKKEFLSNRAREYYTNLLDKFGIQTLLFGMLCRTLYIAGFYIEDRRN